MTKESKLANAGVHALFQASSAEFLLFKVCALPASTFLKLVSGQHYSANTDGGTWRVPVHAGILRALEASATKKYI